MTIAVVDSGGANIASILHALRRLGAEPVFTNDRQEIQNAKYVVLPGVGAAQRAMQTLRKHELTRVIRQLSQPVLGVCLGMQLLFDSSEEGDTQLLGVIPGRVCRFPEGSGLRVPHMGWNTISFNQNVLNLNSTSHNWFYFVHSYFAPVTDYTLATTEHGLTFSAMVRRNNFTGTQFHPERSATAGSQLLKRFLEDRI